MCLNFDVFHKFQGPPWIFTGFHWFQTIHKVFQRNKHWFSMIFQDLQLTSTYLHFYHMFLVCFLYVSCMSRARVAHVSSMVLPWFQHVLGMFPVCFQYVPCICSHVQSVRFRTCSTTLEFLNPHPLNSSTSTHPSRSQSTSLLPSSTLFSWHSFGNDNEMDHKSRAAHFRPEVTFLTTQTLREMLSPWR